jgi:hypothetical protein
MNNFLHVIQLSFNHTKFHFNFFDFLGFNF